MTTSTTSARTRLLRQATRLFAAKGYDGTSTAAIVRGARLNKRMLYHYFGNKQGLYREVLAAQWQALATQLFASTHNGGPALSLVGRLVDELFGFAAAHPEFVRLMMWDALAGGSGSRRLWEGMRAPLLERAVQLVAASHADSSLEARQLVISVLGAVGFYFAFSGSLGDALGHDPLSPRGLEERRRHVLALLAKLGLDDPDD